MMRKYKLTKYDAEHQLPLLAAPTVHIEVPQIHLDEPLPDCTQEPVADDRRRATGDKPRCTRDLVAVLRVRGLVVWTCSHAHQTRDGALACAHQARHHVREPQD